MGISNPNIFITKGLEQTDQVTDAMADNGGSEHLPVVTSGSLSQKITPQTESECIPCKQRNTPRIVAEARMNLGQKLQGCLKTLQVAKTKEDLKDGYNGFKEILFKQWENTRVRKPGRFRHFRNDSLDGMSKRRKTLYKRALKDGTPEAKRT